MTRPGLRVRIAVTITLVVLVAVVGLGLAVHWLLVLDRVDQQRTAAAQRVEVAAQVYRRTGLLSFDARVDDPRLPASVRAAVRRDGSRATLVTGGSTRTLWAAARSGTRVLSTRTRFAQVDPDLRTVDRSLVAAGAGAVVLAGLVALVSAGRLARRLRVAARTARRVAAGEEQPSLRSAVGPGRDEVGDLADAVDAMAARLRSRLAQERQLTADVAHDLRTPVTGLLTAAALLDDSRPAELVRDRAAALAALVEDLLEVSRLDRGVEEAALEEVDLAEVLDRAVRRGRATGEHGPDDVVLDLAPGPDAVVVTDPRRVERVVSNLVRNGLTHGRAPVEVRQRGREVTVRDHGPGFDPTLLREGPRRFRGSGSAAGNGLGLVIAAGQAAVLGADLELGEAPGGGASVRVVLPVGATSRDREEAGRRP